MPRREVHPVKAAQTAAEGSEISEADETRRRQVAPLGTQEAARWKKA